MELNRLFDLYAKELKDIYSSEKQLVEALPKMAEAASTPALRQAFEGHLAETRQHLETVRDILDELDVNPGNVVCDAMRGLVKEGEDVINTKGNPKTRDAALIISAQKAEHYEIASYGALRAYAAQLGYEAHAASLNSILDQEYEADQKLDDLAEGGLLSEGLNEAAQR